MNKKFLIIVPIILILAGIISLYYYNDYNSKLTINNIVLKNYNNTTKKATITIMNNRDKLNYTCVIEGTNNKYKTTPNDGICNIDIDIDDDYVAYLIFKDKETNHFNLSNYIENMLSFSFTKDKIYLRVEEQAELPFNLDTLGKNKNVEFKIDNPEVIKIENNTITALSTGKATISVNKSNSEIEVIVTDLITKPYAIKDKKKLLTCNAYTEEEAALLDNILEYKINEAGYQTRAGAIAAARFITLEFEYRVPYFYANGRLPISETDHSNIFTHIADGEGRYYHKGLYLAQSKTKLITDKWKGPAAWGCNLMNLERNENYGYIPGKLMPNGLECSGLITWVLKNAGFEPGDVGAGEAPEITNQCTDLGEFVYLKDNIDKIKVGDLLNWWGHIAMLIGIDEETGTYYVAESLSYIGGVRAMIYTRSQLLKTFEYTVKMDSFYKEEGKYTNYWE